MHNIYMDTAQDLQFARNVKKALRTPRSEVDSNNPIGAGYLDSLDDLKKIPEKVTGETESHEFHAEQIKEMQQYKIKLFSLLLKKLVALGYSIFIENVNDPSEFRRATKSLQPNAKHRNIDYVYGRLMCLVLSMEQSTKLLKRADKITRKKWRDACNSAPPSKTQSTPKTFSDEIKSHSTNNGNYI